MHKIMRVHLFLIEIIAKNSYLIYTKNNNHMEGLCNEST